MKTFVRTHFMLLWIVSLIMSIINFIGAGVIIVLNIVNAIVLSRGDVGILDMSLAGYIVFVVVGVTVTICVGYCLIKCANIYKIASKMDEEYLKMNKNQIFGWGIFFSVVFAPTILFFIIALVCVIIVNNYIEGLINGDTVSEQVKAASTKVLSDAKIAWKDSKQNAMLNDLSNVQEALRKLKEIKDNGLITEEEYQAKRKKILDI